MRLGLSIRLLMFLILMAAAPVYAQQPLKQHMFEVGPEVYYHSYEEPNVMEEKGVFYGAQAGYEYHEKIYARAEVRAALGEVDYTSPVSGTLDNIEDWLFESRAVAGYDFAAADNLIVTPFLGFGYRYLNDDSAGKRTSTGAAGYERESNYYYSPIGVAALLEPQPDWKLRASAEYDLLWKGKQKSHLSGAISGLNDVENDQDEGYGLRGSVGLEKVGKTTDWWIDGFVRYWNIDDSDLQPITYLGQTIGLGYEPANETVQVGATVGVRF